MKWQEQLWYPQTPKPVSPFLSFLSWCYQLGFTSASHYHKIAKLIKKSHVPVPVIVVGNLTVGGTGKTPLVIALAKYLQSKGFEPGIVSRGYGGSGRYPCEVNEHSSPVEVGDEPLLIFRNTGCRMIVDPNRTRAVETLLNFYSCDIIISDDGLQHHALSRDIEIVVVDGQRRFGNGHCLPAGPLREPVSRLKTVDFVVTNGAAKEGEYSMNFMSREIRPVLPSNKESKTLESLKGQTVHAIAGVGNPTRFFQQLTELGIKVIPHPFPDHYYFTEKDIFFDDDLPVIMTEKDGVKCEKIASKQHWYLAVDAQCPPEFWTNFDQKLHSLLNKSVPVAI
jgi:tetraacyldisaccharide 4'-kinase